MSRVLFDYNGTNVTIQCTKEEKMASICLRFSQKSLVDINNFIFLYKGNTINKELTFQEQINNEDKASNEMKILAIEINRDNTRNNIHKVQDIICPECKENAFIKFNLYSISLSQCKNGHSINNLSLEEYDKIQAIDFSKITCGICNKGRHDSYDNVFYYCLDCKMNLCVLCKEEHSKGNSSHKMIDYDKINYICKNHNDIFTNYCEDCKINICIKCRRDHNNHKRIDFADIIPEDNNIDNSKTKLKKTIDELEQEIKLIIEKLKNIIYNMNIYYNKFDDIISAYNNNNRNYQMIKNINEYMNKNNIVTKDLEKIISDNNLSAKLKNLIFLYYKINSEIPQYNEITEKNNEDINIIKNEIKDENIITKNYIFDYEKEKKEIKEKDTKGDFLFPAIILDIGSTTIRAGLGGDEEPRVRIPTLIGYPKFEKSNLRYDYLIGTEAENNKEFLNIKYPMRRGIVQDLDALEKMFGHIFDNELKIDPSQHPMIITGVSMDLMENMEKIGRLMFETFFVPNLLFVDQIKLGLYACGGYDGLYIDLSDSFTHIVPFCDGIAMKKEEKWYNIGGKDLTEYIQKKISREYGLNFNYLEAKSLKEKICYCSFDFEDECKSGPEEYKYELPDSKIILKDERIRCPEILFNPNIIYKEEKGIAEVSYDILMELQKSYKYNYWDEIYVLGGNSLISGFVERLRIEIKNLSPYSKKEDVNVIAKPERMDFPFIGGSMVSSLSTIEYNYVSTYEYEESGLSAFVKKKI